MSFRRSTYRRIAGQTADGRSFHGDQNASASHAGASRCRLDAGVTAADYHYVVCRADGSHSRLSGLNLHPQIQQQSVRITLPAATFWQVINF